MNKEAIHWVKLVELGAHLIRSNEELESRVEEHMTLAFKENRTRLEDDALDLLTVLIKHYEDSCVSIPSVGPRELLRFIMDQNHLEPADLAAEFGNNLEADLFLQGEHELTLKQVIALSRRFRVELSAFIAD